LITAISFFSTFRTSFFTYEGSSIFESLNDPVAPS